MAEYVRKTSTNICFQPRHDSQEGENFIHTAYLTYRQPQAITRAANDFDRTLSFGPYCSEIPGIFPPFPCCHTIPRAYQQDRKTYNWKQHEKERKGQEGKGKDRKGKERKDKEGGKYMTASLTTVTTRAKEAVHAAANHLTAVTTGVAAATRTTGMANVADASTVLTATNAEAWEETQWANATHPATMTVATTRNAPIVALVPVDATLASSATARKAAAKAAAETARSNAYAAVAETAGSGAGAAVVETSSNAATTAATVETTQNFAVAATAANGTAKNEVAATVTASTARMPPPQ